MKWRRDYDVIVVGASFAGLSAARALAQRGQQVAVLEKQKEPGARPHTTGILVKEAAELLCPPAPLVHKIHDVLLYAPSMKRLALSAPGYYFLTTETGALLRWMAQRTRDGGVDIIPGRVFETARYQRGGLLVEGEIPLTCRYLIGADGARSQVAKAFGLARNRRWLTGMELHVSGLSGIGDDALHCFLDRRLAPGYIAWAVPGVGGVTQVGMAFRDPRGQRPRDRWGLIMKKLESLADVSQAKTVGRRAGIIPTGGPISPFAAKQVMLIGDAAGWVSPLTGGGIHLALDSGRQAGMAVADYLEDGGLEPSRIMARRLSNFTFKRLLRLIADRAPPDLAQNLLLETPPFVWLARQIYFHKRLGLPKLTGLGSFLDPVSER
ncbi:NAD(P)/FAD-dependent oxidoreductase [Limibacillus sp. MBR-115]|jgi:flavin-dependent dehydrogenase|uniref:NAD(P)/FAD-dependent oxidoreductase n=1 Tax=Limibacillus sp. MBR-115 TaxID=3156465 RepID=UPI003393DB44